LIDEVRPRCASGSTRFPFLPAIPKGHGGGTKTRGYIHVGDAVLLAADRIAAATLRKVAGERAADGV